MSFYEIEIAGTSLTVDVYRFACDTARLREQAGDQGEAFNIAEKVDGFHDIDTQGASVRGWFSIIEKFEVEHLVDGHMTTSLLERIRSVEWFADGSTLLVWGNAGAAKVMLPTLSGLCGATATWAELDARALAEKATQCKEVGLAFSKDKGVRRARLAGNLEDSDIDPAAHVAVCKGLVDSPQGPITVTARDTGRMTLAGRRGFILDIGTILWAIGVARKESAAAGAPGTSEPSDAKVAAAARQFANGVKRVLRKHGGGAVRFSAGGKSATIEVDGPGES